MLTLNRIKQRTQLLSVRQKLCVIQQEGEENRTSGNCTRLCTDHWEVQGQASFHCERGCCQTLWFTLETTIQNTKGPAHQQGSHYQISSEWNAGSASELRTANTVNIQHLQENQKWFHHGYSMWFKLTVTVTEKCGINCN